MPEGGDGAEKTEEATPRKMQEARDEGQVALSIEATATLVLLAGFSALVVLGPRVWEALAACLRQALTRDLNLELDLRVVGQLLAADYSGPFLYVLAFAGLIALVAGGITALQVGLHLSPKALVPKFSKISPMAGLQRMFGLRGLMKFVLSTVKLSVVLLLAWWRIAQVIPTELHLSDDLVGRMVDLSWICARLGLELAAVLFVVAFADYLYQKYQHRQDLMMTKQEVKEEMKQSEGDPMVKGRIRQLQRQMAQRRMMQEVPKADVVITNPTHVAVALRYDQGTMAAPTCVAKGYDLIAQRMKAIASEHGVIQVENVALARALYKAVEVGEAIPSDFYQQVAEIIGHVWKLKGRTIGA